MSIEHCKVEFEDEEADAEEDGDGKEGDTAAEGRGGGRDDPLNTPTHSPEKADGDDRSNQQD